MTTNEPDTNPEDDMLATSIDPADVGDTPTPRSAPPAVERPATHEEVIAPKPDLLAKLAKMIGAPKGYGRTPRNPAADEHPVPASDRVEDRRREVNAEAWANSLKANDVTDLAHWRLDALDPQTQHVATMRKYVDSMGSDDRVRNLVLAGATGPGKTSTAIAAGWAALERGLSVRFLEHAKYLQWLRPDGLPTSGAYASVTADRLRRRMRDVDLLILDDLAASLTLNPREPVTQFVKEETLTLIGDRIDTPGKFTIITLNYNSDTVTKMFGEQFVSRLSKHGHVVQFKGESRRGKMTW